MSDTRDDTPVPRVSDSMPSLFSRAEAEYRSNLDEGRAWKRLESRLSKESRSAPAKRYRWVLAAAAACVLVGWAGLKWKALPLMASRANPSATVPGPQSNPALTAIRLAEGQSTLPDGTSVELLDGAEGTCKTAVSQSSLEIIRGRLNVAVARQATGHVFVVKALIYEFVVLGTQFSVRIEGSRVSLDVSEGRVAVRDASHLLKVVELGGHWSSEDDTPAAPTPAPVEPTRVQSSNSTPRQEAVAVEQVADPSDPSSCRDLLRSGNADKAERCYLAIAKGSGLSAEMSLFEVARLRRDVMANPSAALAALDEYEDRFSSGTLAPEVRAARIDLSLGWAVPTKHSLKVADCWPARGVGRGGSNSGLLAAISCVTTSTTAPQPSSSTSRSNLILGHAEIKLNTHVLGVCSS